MDLIAKSLIGSYAKGPIDPYFEYTTLLLSGNGLNGAQNGRTGPAAAYRDGTFLDASTNNFTITRNGNTTQGTFSPFSQTGWGNYFDGSSSLSIANNAAFQMSTGDFCLEGWFYCTGTSVMCPFGTNYLGSSNYIIVTLNRSGAGQIDAAIQDSSSISTSTNSFSNNTWNHLVYCRTSGTVSLFLNGDRVATGTDSSATNPTGAFQIGTNTALARPFSGYLSNVRLIKGSQPYNATSTTITVPTEPLTAISGTSLLTCQSNRFKDNSTNNFTITTSGSPTVVAFSPFNPSASWSAATYGGSGYFDGSGDYLTAPNNTAFDLGSSDFTISLWYYPLVSGNTERLVQWQNGAASNSNYGYFLFKTTANQITFGTQSGGSTQSGTSSSSVQINAWNYIVVTRTGTSATIYVNGVGTSISVYSTIASPSGALLYISSDAGTGQYAQGYLSGLRILKGTADTPSSSNPTSPPTAITNTSLLLNFTNAGIYDATSKNDLETVGNAQISTAISAKWGSGTMAFDGTGDYLLTPSSVNLNYGSGSFTFEGWLYVSSYPSWGSIGTIIANRANASSYTGNIFLAVTNQSSSNKIKIWASSSGSGHDVFNEVDVATGLSTNTWFHLAVVRSGNTWYGFVNGSQTWTTTSSSTLNSNTVATTIGADTNGNGFTGYMQDLRITKGYARYTSSFTAPTAAFPTL